jgi:hypothetical protein
MIGHPVLALQKLNLKCNFCLVKLSSKKPSVSCPSLMGQDGNKKNFFFIFIYFLGSPFVLCESCFGNKYLLINSRDFVHLGPHKTQRFAYHSFGLRLRNRLKNKFFSFFFPFVCLE